MPSGKTIRELIEMAVTGFERMKPGRRVTRGQPPKIPPVTAPEEAITRHMEAEYFENPSAKRWRDENPERSKEYGQSWSEDNKERQLAQIAAWRRNNPDRVKQYNQAYKEKDPERVLKLSRESFERKRAERRVIQAEDPFKMPSRSSGTDIAERRADIPHDMPTREAERLADKRHASREGKKRLDPELKAQREQARLLAELERNRPIDLDAPDIDDMLDNMDK